MSLRFGFLAAVFLALAQSVPAQDKVPSGLTVVGKFYADDGRSVLYVTTDQLTIEGKLTKGAIVGVQFEQSGPNFVYNGTYGRLESVFLSETEWHKFVALWNKARAQALQGTEEDGSYFDGQTELEISSTGRGEVSFALAGNGQVDNHPKDLTILFLKAKDFPEFDRDVKQVAFFFAK